MEPPGERPTRLVDRPGPGAQRGLPAVLAHHGVAPGDETDLQVVVRIVPRETGRADALLVGRVDRRHREVPDEAARTAPSNGCPAGRSRRGRRSARGSGRASRRRGRSPRARRSRPGRAHRAGPRERAHGACRGRHGRLAGARRSPQTLEPTTSWSTLRARSVAQRQAPRPPGTTRLPSDGRRRPPGPPPPRGTTTRADPGSARDRTGRPADHAHHDHRACRLPARLPRHLRDARRRSRTAARPKVARRPRPPVHPRRAVREGERLPGADLQPRPGAASAAAHRAQGQGRFEQISWDEALDEIADPFRATIAEHGPTTDPAGQLPRHPGHPQRA